jgi:alpha-beta hydrolase superfamily lysophospholipase
LFETPDTVHRWRRPVLRAVKWTATGFGALVLALALVPARASRLGPRPHPTGSYDEAVRRFDASRARERDVYDPAASRLLTHGRQTDVVVVLVHGLTNSPKQFAELGRELFDRGANVLIMRMPYHGIASPDGSVIGSAGNLGAIRAEDFRDYADEAVDIAGGLGREIRVMGLSAGGVVAAWVAQNRGDVSRAVVISAATSLPGRTPLVADSLFRNLFSRFPNLSLPSPGKPAHAYQGESTRALAAMYALAESVADQAASAPPAAGSIVVVTNASDRQVDNDDVRRRLVRTWRDTGGDVTTHEFSAGLGLPHDLVDPCQRGQRTDVVHPRLIELLGEVAAEGREEGGEVAGEGGLEPPIP